jgi:hypothetical protein
MCEPETVADKETDNRPISHKEFQGPGFHNSQIGRHHRFSRDGEAPLIFPPDVPVDMAGSGFAAIG